MLGLSAPGGRDDRAARLRQRGVRQAPPARRLRGRGRRRASPTCTPTTSSTSSRTPTRSPTRRVSSRCRCRPGPAPTIPPRPRLIAPPGATESFRQVAGTFGNEDLSRRHSRSRSTRPAPSPEVGPLRFSFQRGARTSSRPSPCGSTATDGVAGLRRGLQPQRASSSSSPRGCDLLLIEATLPRPERTGMRGHLTPEEAGEHARTRGPPGRAHPHLRRARPDLGAQAGGPTRSAKRSRWRARARSTRSEATGPRVRLRP